MNNIIINLCIVCVFSCFSKAIFAAAAEENIEDIFVIIEDPTKYRVKHVYTRDDSENYIVELRLKHKKEYLAALKLVFDPTCTRVCMMDLFLSEGMSEFREILTKDAINLIKVLLDKKRVNHRVILTTSTWFSEDENEMLHNFYKSKGFTVTPVMFGRHYALHFF